MAEYKPSFSYQSKISSSEVVNNEPQTVISQADQSNTMGSVAKKQSRSLLGSLPSYAGIATQVEAVISGGLATYHDILTNPEFQCSLVNLANQFSCGNDLPSCPSPKDIIAIKQEGNSWVADCGCADTTADEQNDIPEPNDNDILSVQLGAEKCLQAARTQALKDCLPPLNLRGNDAAPWDEYSDIIEKEIEGILNNPELSPSEKLSQVANLLEMLRNAITMNGWDVDYGPGFDQFENDRMAFIDALNECVDDINNDCALNQTPSATVLKLLLKGMSRKPEKTCKEGKELNDQCECVCPSGTTECEADGKCMQCPDGSLMYVATSFFGTSYCKCFCPSWTVETFIGDPDAVYVPSEFGGPTPEEYRATNYACLPPCPEGMVREKGGGECKCRKNTGSWLFPKFELVPASGACDSAPNGTILDGYTPNPKNNCECECIERGYEVHINGPDSEGRYTQRCRERCSDETKYDWDSDSCICPETTPCPAGQSRSPNNGCNCSSGSYSYTSLTTAELKKIASSFGYNLKSNVELL